MRYLLDTHTLLWWLENDKRLKNTFKKVISNPKNVIYISVVSGWEISIKQKKGKLPLKTTVRECFEKSHFETIPITVDHILRQDKLPMHHKDPFDRMLISQAKEENLILVTNDEKIKKYSVKTLS